MSRVWGRHSPTSTTRSWDAISICEIVATGRYLLSAFSVSFENPNNKTNSVLKAGSANVNRDVSCLCGRRSPRIKFLPLFCSGVIRLARIWAGSWRCIQSGRLIEFSRCGVKNCKPVTRLQIYQKIKNPPRRGQRFCRRGMAAKWFGVAAGRLFSVLKQLVWDRGYHEQSGASSENLKFWAR